MATERQSDKETSVETKIQVYKHCEQTARRQTDTQTHRQIQSQTRQNKKDEGKYIGSFKIERGKYNPNNVELQK